MKKTFLGLAFIAGLMATTANAFALTAGMETSMTLHVGDEPTIIKPITLNVQADKEITAENDIMIKIPDVMYATWDKSVKTVSVSGTAVTNGKIKATANVTYPNANLRTVILDVDKDLAKDETIIINGLTIRAYDRTNTSKKFEYDLNKDGVAEAFDVNGITITSSGAKTDTTAPYAVTDFKAEQTSVSEVKLTWVNPPDLDTKQIVIDKTWVRNGLTSNFNYTVPVNLNTVAQSAQYSDSVMIGDVVTYKVYAEDDRNDSEIVTSNITVAAQVPTQQPTQQPTQGNTQQPTQEPTQQPTQPNGNPATPPDGIDTRKLEVTFKVEPTLKWGTWIRVWYFESIVNRLLPNKSFRIDFLQIGGNEKGIVNQTTGTGRTNSRATFRCTPGNKYAVSVTETTNTAAEQMLWRTTVKCD